MSDIIDRKPVFDVFRDILGRGFVQDEVRRLDTAIDRMMGLEGIVVTAEPVCTDLTERMVLEILEHEAIVPEAYKDSVGVWTWGVGVTDASGHHVLRYRDYPQPIERCLAVYVWLLRTRYLPDVMEAFVGCDLAEHQLAAALSFHYNTGAIKRASWVASFRAGQSEKAHDEFMNWSKPREIITRRKAERDLFFDGRWTSDGKVTVYDVAKPSYSPKWSSARRIDVRGDLERAMA